MASGFAAEGALSVDDPLSGEVGLESVDDPEEDGSLDGDAPLPDESPDEPPDEPPEEVDAAGRLSVR